MQELINGMPKMFSNNINLSVIIIKYIKLSIVVRVVYSTIESVVYSMAVRVVYSMV